ncbi:MAG: hypothetical protein DI538_20360 [Azospira oryzae]|jgi:two-component system phosphate regulon sensor histidine kinase PhoR|nr:MAG: hypothetical protein DI538_20360 [Azospira oryzae]
MSNKYLGRILLFGTMVLACLLIVQVYWFKKAFDVGERQFDHSVQVALKKVADSVSHDSEVSRLSSNFYFVSTESSLDNEHLDQLLRDEFQIRSLNIDYELGVYNADDDTLVYGHYVQATRPPLTQEQLEADQQSATQKNFAVYFPKKSSYVAAQLNIWIFSTIMLLLMMGFFAFAIYSLLKERKFASLKNDFINNMTHEFKTPVTNIQIAGEVLKNKVAKAATAEDVNVYIDILLKENDKLKKKIDQVLLGSSVGQVKRPALERIDVHQLIRECAEAFHLKMQQRQGKLLLEFKAAHSSILADRELLTEAINNIIDNAEKYSPHSPHIKVVTRDQRNGIEINIVDNGIGIAPDMKNKVFEKFFRIRSGDIHTVKGFGLGLSFVKEVVQFHRGKVDLLSELNKGTEVRILLPSYA